MDIGNAYQILYSAAVLVFLLLCGAVLIRSVRGPGATDRILCVNMLGTLVVSCIVVLSRMLQEDYLIDVALIYTMVSFISVLMLAASYIPSGHRKDPLSRAQEGSFSPEKDTDPGQEALNPEVSGKHEGREAL